MYHSGTFYLPSRLGMDITYHRCYCHSPNGIWHNSRGFYRGQRRPSGGHPSKTVIGLARFIQDLSIVFAFVPIPLGATRGPVLFWRWSETSEEIFQCFSMLSMQNIKTVDAHAATPTTTLLSLQHQRYSCHAYHNATVITAPAIQLPCQLRPQHATPAARSPVRILFAFLAVCMYVCMYSPSGAIHTWRGDHYSESESGICMQERRPVVQWHNIQPRSTTWKSYDFSHLQKLY